ncbi:MAG: asparagine synthase (glutamine-hydrolyzing) [Gemmatimonadaceae bacterium]|nr:asparagine synthase (glutamine-hydrolyzing) [Gemmatimonadaceae bacterium]
MCGIIGVVSSSASAWRARLVTARDMMGHRGPDGAGLWGSPGVLLGARRLAIVDRSPGGQQPMASPDGRVAIVHNGEAYNFQILRRELEREFAFVSRTDTEVLMHGYRRWGLRGLVDRIEGMFAFAIWDARRRRLSVARDRAGQKPFFYCHRGSDFAFASTASAVASLMGQEPVLDPRALDAFLVYQAVPAPLGIFKGMSQLPPAHCLTFDAESGLCATERYWRRSFVRKTAETEAEVVDHVEQLVRESVRKRLLADVSVGTFLSGGVDSSIITAIAAQEAAGPIEAVTLGFEKPALDERHYARIAAQRAGVRLHEEVLRPELVVDLPAIVWHYGQPVADVSIVPNYYLAAAARRHMVVALNGDGGDELFGGYRRPLVEHVVGPYRERVPARARTAIARWVDRCGVDRWPRLAVVARSGSMPAADAFTYDRAFRLWRVDGYTSAFKAALHDWDPDSLFRAAWHEAECSNDVDRTLAGDFATYLPDQLLTKADRSSMAHGLEARSPMLDTALMEYAACIQPGMHFAGLETKRILKRVAERFVPGSAAHRRKRGFVMPASAWLRGEVAEYARAALDNRTFFDRGWMDPGFIRRMLDEHFAGRRDWGEQMFTLLVLEVWARIVLDRTLDRDSTLDAVLSRPQRGRRYALRTLQVGMEWFSERPSGLNRVYKELVDHLPAAGVGVRGLVAGSDAVARESLGIVRGIAPESRPLLGRLVALMREGRAMLRGDPACLAVIHFALYGLPLLPALRRRRFVVHFQGPWGLEGRAERQSRLTVAVKTLSERVVYRRAASLIVLSHPFGRILEERFGVPRERIHVIPGGVDADHFAIKESRAEARRLLGWPADRRIVLGVRRLAHRMGLDDLIAAAELLRAEVPDALVMIAGRGVLGGALAQAIERRGLQNHVRMLGFVPDDMLPYAYRAADLSVVPSVALEGFGLIVAESLAAGTPALVTPVGGLPEAVGSLSPHLVLPATGAAALAAGMAGILTGRVRAPSADECARYAREHYDWPVIARRVAAVYEEAAGR